MVKKCTIIVQFNVFCGKISGNALSCLINANTNPRQIGGLGFHSKDWHDKHLEWEKSISK
jgi:hypothetical protein